MTTQIGQYRTPRQTATPTRDSESRSDRPGRYRPLITPSRRAGSIAGEAQTTFRFVTDPRPSVPVVEVGLSGASVGGTWRGPPEFSTVVRYDDAVVS